MVCNESFGNGIAKATRVQSSYRPCHHGPQSGGHFMTPKLAPTRLTRTILAILVWSEIGPRKRPRRGPHFQGSFKGPRFGDRLKSRFCLTGFRCAYVSHCCSIRRSSPMSLQCPAVRDRNKYLVYAESYVPPMHCSDLRGSAGFSLSLFRATWVQRWLSAMACGVWVWPALGVSFKLIMVTMLRRSVSTLPLWRAVISRIDRT